jgi:hypothetical protein
VHRYRVEALEKFLVRTTYFVDADSPEEAEQSCRDGKVSYESHQIAEGDDEWIETLTVEIEEPLRFVGPTHDAHA